MMKYSITVFVCFLSLCISCKQHKNYDGKLKSNEFISFLSDKNYNYQKFTKIIVIPGVGCGGCISDAQAEFNKNYKDAKTLYIFTAIADLKIFKNSLAVDALTYKNVILDVDDALPTMGFKSIYPSTIKIKQDVAEINRL